MAHERGVLFILSGPSGVGKGTVRKRLFETTTDLKYSVSATTRQKRPREVDGTDYFFKSKKEFEQLIREEKLLEHAKYVNNYYGTPREYVEKTLAAGYDVFLEIEVQGAMQVKQNFSEGVFIFLFPPSLEELRKRISKRGTETEDLVKHRLNEAQKEIQMMSDYDYIVVNDDINVAVEKIQSIITSEHCKQERFAKRYEQLIER